MPDPTKIPSPSDILGDKLIPSPSDILGDSEKKKSTSTVIPPKSVSGTPTGSSVGVNPAFKNTTPSPIPDFNSMQSVKSVVQKPKYPESENGYEPTFLENVVSTVKSKANKLATGSSQLGADIAAIPELLYDTAAIPQNWIAEHFDIPSLQADSEKFKKNIGVRNAVKELYQGEVIKLREHAKQVDTKYQDGIYNSFKNGDILGGFDQVTNSFVESLPATASIMLGGAYAKAPQLLTASTMVFGAGKNEQLKKENPEMNTNARTINALGTGFAEGTFETMGSGSIGAAARGLIERQGAAKAATILKDGLVKSYKYALSKNPFTASLAVEGVEEWATQVTQNSIDVATGAKPKDFNIFDGAADAFIGGAFGGAVFGGGLKGIEQMTNLQDRNAIKTNIKNTQELQKALQNPDISEEAKLQIEKTIESLVKTNQQLIIKNTKHADNLHPKLKEQLVESITKIEETKQAVKLIKLDGATNDAQKQILLDGLKEDFKKHNKLKADILEGKATPVDVLPLNEQDKIKRQALKELTAEQNPDGTKSIEIDNAQIVERANKIYKKQEELVASQESLIDNAPLPTVPENYNIVDAPVVNNNLSLEDKSKETEAKIKRKDLFSAGGSFSNQLGESGVDSVPTNHTEINGIEFVEFSNPNTGTVDVVMSGTSDTDFVGYYRIYENGKPTDKWSSKFENQSRNKENFKTMIGGVQSMLPEGHQYTETTSISTDGLRVWEQQLSRGYEMQTDKNGNVVTNEVAINGDAIVNELGIDVNQGNFDNISVTNNQQFQSVKKALLPYLQKFGLNESNIRNVNGTVEIDLPVLRKTKKQNEQTPTTPEAKPQAEVPQQAEAEKVSEVSPEVADVEKRREEELDNSSSKFNKTVYHGSKSKIEGEFKIGEGLETIHFTEDKSLAESYGKNINEALIDTKNPLIIEGKKTDAEFDEILDKYTTITKEEANGYDSIIINIELDNGKTYSEVIVFDKSQVKFVDKINAKYDAELEALNQATPPVEDVVAPSVENDNSIKQVKSFKKGEGGTFGVFEDAEGKLYKSTESLYNKYNEETKQWEKSKTGNLTLEHKFLSENQDLKHLPRVGKLVETSEGKAFEIEKLNEVENGSLTLEEIAQINKTLKTLNKKGIFVADKNSVMRRDNGEIVLVDLSNARNDSYKSRGKETVSKNIIELLPINEQNRYNAGENAKHSIYQNETFNKEVKAPKEGFDYLLTQRPPSIGTHPLGITKDPIEVKIGNRTAYRITYKDKLSDTDVKNFELTPETTIYDIGKVYEENFAGNKNYYVISDVHNNEIKVTSFSEGKRETENYSQRQMPNFLSKLTEVKNEATPETNTPTNGNVPLGASNVGESGNAKPKSNSKSSVPSSVDGGEVKGDTSVKDIENTNKLLDKSVLKDDQIAIAVTALPKDGTINYKDVKGNMGFDFSRYFNNPDALDEKSKKIYDSMVSGEEIIHKKLLISSKNGQLMDGTHRFKARLAMGQENFEYSKSNESFFKQPYTKTISEAYHKAKIDGGNPELVKAVEDIIGKPSETTQPKSVKGDVEGLKFTTHTGEQVSGKRLNDALNKVADDWAKIQRGIKEEDKYADHVTEKQKEENLAKGLEYAEGIRNGKNIDNFTISQRINTELTGESVPLFAPEKQPTTKERIAERIKLSDAKVDAKADAVKAKLKAFAAMFPSADINPEDYDINGFSMDAIIDMVAKAAKAIANGSIVTSEHIKQAIQAYNTQFDDKIDPKAVEERINPKEEAEGFKREKRKSSVLKRIREGGNSTEINDIIDKIGLNYEGRKQEQVYADGVNFVKEVGIAEAYNAIKNGELKDSDTINVVYATILQEFPKMAENEISKVSDPQELSDLVKELDDLHEKIYTEFKAKTIDAGRGSAILNFIYNQDLKIRYSLSQQIENFKKVNNGVVPDEVKDKMKELDRQYKEANKRIEELETLLQEAQEQKYFENIVDEEKRNGDFKYTQEDFDKELQKSIENIKNDIKNEKKSSANKKREDVLTPKEKSRKQELRNKYFRANDITSIPALLVDPEFREYLGLVLKQAKGDIKIFSKEMLDTLGKAAKTHLPDLFKEAQNESSKKIGKLTVDEDDNISIPNSLIRSLVEQGFDDIKKLTSKILSDNKEEFPELTERKIRDAITKYGKTVEPNNVDPAPLIRKIKRAGKAISAIEDIAKGIRPKRSGLQRDKLDPEERRILREINESMKNLPLDKADLSKHLKTALDAIKTRLSNHIEDLNKQIAEGEKWSKDKSSIELDQDAKDLVSKRDSLKIALDELVNVPKTEDEIYNERIASKLAEREKVLQGLIEGKKNDPTGRKSDWSAEISKVNTEISRLREKQKAIQSQKTPDEIYQKEVEAKINSLKKRIDDVKIGKVKDTEGNSSVWNNEISELETELKNLKDGKKVVNEPKVTVDDNGKVRIPTEMIKNYISKGGTDLSEFAAQVQESIKDEFPDVSVRDIRESVSNYGKKANKSRSQIVEDIQKLKSEERLRLEYEDLKNRISKEKNETKKRTLSQTEKRLKEQIKQLQDDLGITETERTNRSVNYTKKRIEILRDKIKNNDFAKKEIKPIVESQELREAKIEKNRIQEEFDYLSYQQELENRTFLDKAEGFAKDIYDSQRVTLATGEMSFVGAQGGLYMVDATFSRQTLKNLIENFKGTTAKEWKANPFGTVLKMIKSAHSAESLIKMFNAMGTANNYLDFQRMLKEDINYDVYLKSGLRLLGEDIKTQVKDDNFIGNNILTLLKIPIHLIDRIEKKELKNLKLSLAETEKKRTTLQGYYEKLKTGKISDKNKKTATEIFSNANPLSTFERGNGVFMNMARVEMFNKYAAALYASGKNPIDHLSDFKKLASAVNTITGSGNMNQTVTMALPVLNKLMFSARYFSASWNLTPPMSLYYLAKLGNYDGMEIDKPGTWKTWKPTAAQKAFVKPMVKGFVAFYGLTLMTMAMINAAIDDDDEMPEEEKARKRAYIEYDPRSSDFMQVISGNTRTDFFGPYRGNVVLLSKLATGQTKNGQGIIDNGVKFGSRRDFDIGAEYLAGKANPFPGMFIRYSQGAKEKVLNPETGLEEEKRMLFDKEIGIGYQVKHNTLPIFVTTVKDIVNEDPVLGASFYTTLALFGKQTSVYKTKEPKEKKGAFDMPGIKQPKFKLPKF